MMIHRAKIFKVELFNMIQFNKTPGSDEIHAMLVRNLSSKFILTKILESIFLVRLSEAAKDLNLSLKEHCGLSNGHSTVATLYQRESPISQNTVFISLEMSTAFAGVWHKSSFMNQTSSIHFQMDWVLARLIIWSFSWEHDIEKETNYNVWRSYLVRCS